MSELKSLDSYREFLLKVSAKFDEIFLKHREQMRCAQGCHQCCTPGITVFKIERENIRAWIQDDSSRKTSLEKLEQADPHQGERCRFLEADGRCGIYPVRPIVCRSHGAPLAWKAQEVEGGAQDGVVEDTVAIDVCPLNFTEPGILEDLSLSDTFNLDTLNVVLTALNRQYSSSDSERRYALSLQGIVSN